MRLQPIYIDDAMSRLVERLRDYLKFEQTSERILNTVGAVRVAVISTAMQIPPRKETSNNIQL